MVSSAAVGRAGPSVGDAEPAPSGLPVARIEVRWGAVHPADGWLEAGALVSVVNRDGYTHAVIVPGRGPLQLMPGEGADFRVPTDGSVTVGIEGGRSTRTYPVFAPSERTAGLDGPPGDGGQPTVRDETQRGPAGWVFIFYLIYACALFFMPELPIVEWARAGSTPPQGLDDPGSAGAEERG